MGYLFAIAFSVVITVIWRNMLLEWFALDKESLLLRRARRQVLACRTLSTFVEVDDGCNSVQAARERLNASDLNQILSSMSITGFDAGSYERRIRLFQSLEDAIYLLETRLATTVGTSVFHDQCLDALLQEATSCGIDVTDDAVVVFEMHLGAWLVKSCISLYIPLITVASRRSYVAVQAPDWFYQLIQHTLDAHPQCACLFPPVISGVPDDVWLPKAYQRSFGVSADILAAAVTLWEPDTGGVYIALSDAISAAKALS